MLETDGILVLIVTAVFLLLLVSEKASYAELGICLMVVLPLTGVIDASTAIAGFSNKAVVTIAGLYVVGAALSDTGAMDFVGRWLMRASGGSPRRTTLFVCLVVAAMSAFMNDTAVVVVFIPLLLSHAAESGVPPSKLLMPLSFAALLGGMCTLVGTSTNLIVSGIAESLGGPVLTMFSLTPVGVPIAIVCILFMAVAADKLLPVHPSLSAMMAATPSKQFVTELLIGAGSPLVGRGLKAVLEDLSVTVMFVVRDEVMQPAVQFGEDLALGDVLILRGEVDELLEMQHRQKLESLQNVKLDPRSVELFEVALAPGSMRAGMRVGELGLRETFGATTMAVLRAGQHLHERVAQLALQVGDVLLVCGDEESRARLDASPDYFLLAGRPRPLLLRGKAKRALWIAAGVVTLLAANSLLGFKAMPPSAAALTGALAMVLSGCVSTRRAIRGIDWAILVFIAGTLALGEAMRVADVAGAAADLVLTALADLGVAAVASGLVLLGFVFNFLVSHSAVAALFTPIALAAASALARDAGHAPDSPEAAAITTAMLLAVCYGGSMCFATPIAHQVNLMVCGPGGYRFVDFLRFGVPVSLIAWVVASVGIPIACGLW